MKNVRASLALALLAAVILTAVFLPVEELLSGAQQWTEANQSTALYFATGILVIGILLMLPASLMLMLAGFLFGYLTRYILVFNETMQLGVDTSVTQSIGYIIPGLIAYWMMRQGIVETLCTMIMASFIVRLALVTAHGGKLIELAVG